MTRFRRCLVPIIGDHFTIAGACRDPIPYVDEPPIAGACITSNAEGSASAAPSPHQPSVEAGPSAPSGPSDAWRPSDTFLDSLADALGVCR